MSRLMTELMAAVGVEAFSYWLAAHPDRGGITVPELVAIAREQAKREQMEADIDAIVEFGRCRKDIAAVVGTLIEATNAIRAAFAKAEQERKGGAA